ncbi:MAG: hypothetical protein ABR861_04895 [Terriglobales bacterium]
MKSLEQQLHEQDQELRELRKRVGKPGATTNLAQELSESRLPEAAQARLRKRLPATATKDVIRRAISEERELVRQIRMPANQDRLVESYKAIGLSEKEAKIAARVESAVKDVTESQSKLANAARLLGLSEKEAAVFARI